MRLPARSLSSVTRWLLMVVSCAVLETAQPMSAATAEATGPAPEGAPAAGPAENDPPAPPSTGTTPRSARSADTLLIPAANPRPAATGPRGAGSSSWLVVLGFCASGAAWYWWRRRGPGPLGRPARARQIDIEESRPLGNRQYLVVAAVGDRKFLLGVTPGSIQLLAPLEPKEERVHEPVA